ncbi:hypothetical protein [Bacteroides sp. 519]|uniref:hypothetical protein n=1 Tax=Bacteroides sp. 519 TaxID=2302937 RepID=UPI0013D76947|nr:hypothetical protein [Bacteroides sp. 519]NDV59873.1 hypothetical protein [Bacteroides sp. 519]
MTTIELETRKTELFKLIANKIDTEDMLQEAIALLKRLVSSNKDNNHCETQEELHQSISEAIDEFHQRKTIPHKQVKRKVL